MEEAENSSKVVNPPSQETDYSQGYQVILSVFPDGFSVVGPSPLPQGDQEEDERIPDLPTALKHIIAISKENPLDTDLNAHFESGYQEA